MGQSVLTGLRAARGTFRERLLTVRALNLYCSPRAKLNGFFVLKIYASGAGIKTPERWIGKA